MRSGSIWLLVLGFFALTSSAWAESTQLAIEGTLRSQAGSPVPDGDYAMAITVYDAQLAGNSLFEEDFLAVPVQYGLFALDLGAKKTKLDDSVFPGEARWIGVTVAGNPELPRQLVHDVPSALSARVAKLALDVQCSGCIGSADLAVGAVQAQHVAFSYAGSDSKGGQALSAKQADSATQADSAAKADNATYAASAGSAKVADFASSSDEAGQAKKLACTGCISAAQFDANVVADLVKGGSLAKVAQTGKYADLQGGPDLSGYGALAANNVWTGSQTLGAISLGASAQFNKNQALLFRFQNAANDPVPCDATVVGLTYYNTTANSLVICNGSGYVAFAKVGPPGSVNNPGASCKAIVDAGSNADGVYWLKPDASPAAFQAYCDMKNGGWTLVMKTSTTSPWGYSDKVWTDNDNAAGQIPLPTDNSDEISRAFYKLAATQTKACIKRYDDGSWACENFVHAATVPRDLANSGPLASSQGVNNLLTATWKSITAGGVWGAYTWHRFGWNTGTSTHGGARLGFSADNDSSDSQDSCIGFGLFAAAGNSISAGAGYFQYPWSPAPSPIKAVLEGQIWVR